MIIGLGNLVGYVSALFQIFDTSDLPGGVVNILTGDREHLAKHLSEHQVPFPFPNINPTFLSNIFEQL